MERLSTRKEEEESQAPVHDYVEARAAAAAVNFPPGCSLLLLLLRQPPLRLRLRRCRPLPR